MTDPSACCMKSVAELVKEISILELEVIRLEQYLLSSYRTAFDRHLASSSTAAGHASTPPVECHAGDLRLDSTIQISHQDIPKSVSGHRILADHLGASITDHVPEISCKLSEDIIRCISAIYCRLAPAQHAAYNVGGHSVNAYAIQSSIIRCQSHRPALVSSVLVRKEQKIVLPKILYYYAKDAYMELSGLMEMVCDSMPDAQRKATKGCLKRMLDKCVEWSPYKSTFRCLVHRDLAK
ncbi:uncharacterized protein [Elaeis guineensis]|uniref:uncharacterized protein n=1 Tax=Elaeis guineensis var. tenera TaxID=51953 RepID=UPI003C6CDA3D